MSEIGRAMLADAGLADTVMAPSADMFELGVKVQVLRKGTLFGVRALKLYDLYRSYSSLDEIPDAIRHQIEREVFRKPVQEVLEETRAYFANRDPEQLDRAARYPRHEIALVFRWYLGSSSRWAVKPDETRRSDFQIWCGPAMGAFNLWSAGSFLAEPKNRTVVQIALNLLEGAAVITRGQQLRSLGVAVPSSAFLFRPRKISEKPACASAGRPN